MQKAPVGEDKEGALGTWGCCCSLLIWEPEAGWTGRCGLQGGQGVAGPLGYRGLGMVPRWRQAQLALMDGGRSGTAAGTDDSGGWGPRAWRDGAHVPSVWNPVPTCSSREPHSHRVM